MDFRYDWSDGGGEGNGFDPPETPGDNGIRLPLWVHAVIDAAADSTPAVLVFLAGVFFLIGTEVIASVACR